MYQRIRHKSIDTYNPKTLDKRRATAPITLLKAPWEEMDTKEQDTETGEKDVN